MNNEEKNPENNSEKKSFISSNKWIRWIAIAAGVGVFLLAFFLLGLEVVHYTESTEFCTSCHNVMNPEKTTHQFSPHAHTDCGTCHIGPGVIPMVKSKLENARYLWVYPLGLYERPIPTPLSTLRPAEATCNQCHWPEKFYPISLEVRYRYGFDEQNSLTRVLLPFKIGNGEEMPEGRGPGIHWHIENDVYYITTDENRQDIPWVQTTVNGETVEYLAVDTDLTQEEIDNAEKRKMDCMDCHNRATHVVKKPENLMNEALSNGDIPSDLPYIMVEGTTVLQVIYDSTEEAITAIEGLEQKYQEQYPQVYAERQEDIQVAIEEIKQIYERTHFPFMNVYWNTYPNNIGHLEFPGCYRCHGGSHLSTDNEAIRAECNLCHALPQVAEPGQDLPAVDLTVMEMPENHYSSLWIARHRFEFDQSCAGCHTIENAGGTDNASFCSNSVCHGPDWEYLDINNMAVLELVDAPQLRFGDDDGPQTIPHPIEVDMDCTRCHGLEKLMAFPESHSEFEMDACTNCHEPTSYIGEPPEEEQEVEGEDGDAEEEEETPDGPPSVPHTLEGREECFQCHDPEGNIQPAPEDHIGRSIDGCINCHTPLED